MKVDINLLAKNQHHVLHFYEAQLSVDDIDDLEAYAVFIFPVEMVYSVKQLITAIHLTLDNSPHSNASLETKTTVSNLFYGRKKPFRSYYNRYVVVFLDSDPKLNIKKTWDSGLKSLKDKSFCDINQLKKAYHITEKQAEKSTELDNEICSAINQEALRTF